MWNRIPFFRSRNGKDHLGPNPPLPPEPSFGDELGEMTELSYQQRLLGFFMSLAMGIVLIAIAVSFVPLLAIYPKKFSFFFTCGNFFCVSSTAFLVGIRRQFRTMFESHRIHAASVYFLSMFMTLVAALHWRSSSLTIIFASVQIVAIIWYGFSYIPFARRVVKLFWSYLSYIVGPICGVLWKGLKALCGLCGSASN